jgi:glycerophosphoryl diester phosphodiesterase
MANLVRPFPLIIGHRGASGYRPEHTAPAYELAFALGADSVEPDIVSTRDGVLVLRHENEISGTTDVATRAEFLGRRSTKVVDGAELTGWFTEDFTWAELRTLQMRERLPALRRSSATFDGRYPMLRLRDLLGLVDNVAESTDLTLGVVAEIKHATYFESIGLPLDELLAAELNETGWNTNDGRLTVESFELAVLAKIHERGVHGKRVYLAEARGRPYDEVAQHGSRSSRYADQLTQAGLSRLSGVVHGVSVPKALVLPVGLDTAGGASELVGLAHAAGLEIYCWTLRPENTFLAGPYRGEGLEADFGDWPGEFRAVMSTGVDGVFVDHPDLAVAVRAGLRGGPVGGVA